MLYNVRMWTNFKNTISTRQLTSVRTGDIKFEGNVQTNQDEHIV